MFLSDGERMKANRIEGECFFSYFDINWATLLFLYIASSTSRYSYRSGIEEYNPEAGTKRDTNHLLPHLLVVNQPIYLFL